MSEEHRPYNPEAERTVLGAVLLDGARALTRVQAIIGPSDFYAPKAQLLYRALVSLAERNDPLDLVTLRDELLRTETLEQAGGAAALGKLLDGLPHVSNVEQWARIVRHHSLRRQIAAAAERIASEALAQDADPESVLEAALGKLLDISSRATEAHWLDNPATMREAFRLMDLRANADHGIVGLRTGLNDLDMILQGIRPGQFGVFGARLGQGKSILLGQTAGHVAAQGGVVAFFSLEMGGPSLVMRWLSAGARVNVSRMWSVRDPALRDERWARIAGAHGTVSAHPLWISTSAHTVPKMRTLCRQLQAQQGRLDLVVVDYLGLVRPVRRYQRRHEEVGEISLAMKAMAMDLGVPVIAAHQLNRESEGRPDKRPTMADLAESDQVGRDCDWCVLIHRDPPPTKDEIQAAGSKGAAEKANHGKADLIVAKNRDGRTGVARFAFHGWCATFEPPSDTPTFTDREEATA